MSELRKVLLVDDDAMLLKLASIMLKRLNFKVITANCGNEAVTIIENDGKSFDLMITDMQMPDLTGVQLAEIFREKFPKIKIAILTGLGGDDNSILRDTTLTNVNILGKPFRFGDLEELTTHLF